MSKPISKDVLGLMVSELDELRRPIADELSSLREQISGLEARQEALQTEYDALSRCSSELKTQAFKLTDGAPATN